jgi:hypothetical protein
LLELCLPQLKKVVSLLTDSEKEVFIIQMILECIADDQDEERRLSAVILIDELAEALG